VSWPEGVVVRVNEPMAKHSPWRVGGPCDAYVVVHRREALGDALTGLRDAGWSRTLVGAGTRTVFRDPGVAGAVLRLGVAFGRVAEHGEGWSIGAATPLAVLAALPGAPAAWRPLRRAPGSLGASIVLDDGWEPWVDGVCAHARGAERWTELSEFKARGANAVVVEVRLRRAPREAGAHGPALGLPTSWFSPGKGAAKPGELRRLLRKAALADVRLREVVLPAVSPELLVNLGGSTARDLSLLHRSAIERVHQVAGIELGDRMRWVGKQG
jgi:UDP-N-acetylenolpyruvoylglucosamine reductase